MAEHEHGKMDVSSQEKTFGGFVNWLFGVGALSVGVLIFLAIFNS